MCDRAFILYGYTYTGEVCIPHCWFSDADADCGDRDEENNYQPTSKWYNPITQTNSYNMSLQQTTFTLLHNGILFKSFHSLMGIKLIIFAMCKYT